jgi:hypothetical protein
MAETLSRRMSPLRRSRHDWKPTREGEGSERVGWSVGRADGGPRLPDFNRGGDVRDELLNCVRDFARGVLAVRFELQCELTRA